MQELDESGVSPTTAKTPEKGPAPRWRTAGSPNSAVGGAAGWSRLDASVGGRKRTEWVARDGQWKHVSLRPTVASAGGTIFRPADVISLPAFPAAGIWQLFSRVYRSQRRVCAALTGGGLCRPNTHEIDIRPLSVPLCPMNRPYRCSARDFGWTHILLWAVQ